MKEIREVSLNEIVVGPRKRTLNPEKVRELAESIKVSGLLQPILLATERRLVHGHHRLEAARLLGWESILAIVGREHLAALDRAWSASFWGSC